LAGGAAKPGTIFHVDYDRGQLRNDMREYLAVVFNNLFRLEKNRKISRPTLTWPI